MKKILCIGDAHFKDNLSYSEYVKDARLGEKNDILNSIIKSSEDCGYVVFLGDQFQSKNNSSEVVREFVEFVEKFEDKEIYIINGNHEKRGDGKTAIDFMREVNKPNWHIITSIRDFTIEGKKVTFLPFLVKAELGTNDTETAAKDIIKVLTGGDILFHHFAVSDTEASHGISTNVFKEVVLPKKDLEKKYSWVIGGHIHTPKQYGATIVAGSIFTNEVGEKDKYVWKLDLEDMSVKKVALPGRHIHKIENPSIGDLSSIPKSDIIKVVMTNKELPIEEIKSYLKKFDSYIYIEQFPNERKKLHFDEGAVDFSIENLLKIYSQERGVDMGLLNKGFDLIK